MSVCLLYKKDALVVHTGVMSSVINLNVDTPCIRVPLNKNYILTTGVIFDGKRDTCSNWKCMPFYIKTLDSEDAEFVYEYCCVYDDGDSYVKGRDMSTYYYYVIKCLKNKYTSKRIIVGSSILDAMCLERLGIFDRKPFIRWHF